MEQIKILGGNKLVGTVKISGAKNAVLPLIAAAILSDQEITLENVPHLSDILVMNEILQDLNVKVYFNNNSLVLNAKDINNFTSNYNLVSKMRASILVLGPLLAKYGEARVALPGGCSIGERPVDLHIKGMQALGAEIHVEHGFIQATAPRGLIGAEITLETVSVGATENIIMAGVLAKGTTVIINAAKEPEIVDLANCLNKMGANIKGVGTSLIEIKGVTSLYKTKYHVLPDRIEAASYAIAGAATKGELILEGVHLVSMQNIFDYLTKSGAVIKPLLENKVLIKGPEVINAVDVETAIYPGFPTDIQAQWMAYMCLAKGKSIISENIFENRFTHVPELKRMGADIVIKDHSTAVVNGVLKLEGAEVKATDIRASFALVIAGLVAEGETLIRELSHLDRGYQDILSKLIPCGIDIKRIGV